MVVWNGDKPMVLGQTLSRFLGDEIALSGL